jgi:hypothetical protein
MTGEQMDLVEASIRDLVQQRGHVGVIIYCTGNPQPFSGQYERLDPDTVRVISGAAASIISIDSIAAVTIM